MIEVKNLTKFYGDRPAVRDVTFEVNRGEILGFLGPNGAGKTTTMRILTGFLPPTGGSAHVAGFDVFENPLEVKARVGYMPENPPIYHEMLVSTYLDFVSRIKGVPKEKRRRAFESVVEKCSLTGVTGRLVGNLSRGYKQRVGLAQALIHDPEVLVLDEPTSGLDPEQIHEIRELIKGLGGEHTIILSTHILPEVTMICGRVVIINEGRVVAAESLDALSSQVRQAERIAVRVKRSDTKVVEDLGRIPGVSQVTPAEDDSLIVEAELGKEVAEAVADMSVKKGWGLVELRPLAPSLEEIYLNLISRERRA